MMSEEPKEVRVFRFYYNRTTNPDPKIQRFDPRTGKLKFISCEINEGFHWAEFKVFFGDDYLLECAVKAVIAAGYDVISVIPAKMYIGDGTSYQIVAVKREE